MLNNKYKPYICFCVVFCLFIVSLFVFKPIIKMMELYTLFARVSPDTLTPILDFGAENFVVQSSVPAIPNIELGNYPLIMDFFICMASAALSIFAVFFIPNLFIGFCIGLSVIIGFCLFAVYMSHVHSVWIPIVWPILIQLFMFFSILTAKASLKQTKMLSTIKLFGYDINKFPNSVPFIKNIVQQPKKTDVTLACFKIKVPQLYMEQSPTPELVYRVNEVFKTIVDTGLKYSAIIEKTSNNTIIMYWIDKDNAMNAVQTALEVKSLIQTKSDVIKVSCGISTENSLFAILGSDKFANYTIMGNIGDIAARLESACIFHNTSILISNHTLNKLQGKLLATHKGIISVHGIQGQVEFYEPMSFIKVEKGLAND